MKTRRIYISGLWIIPRNLKHPEGHYFALIEESIKNAKGETLYFFSNCEDIKEKIIKVCQSCDIRLFWNEMSVSELPAFERVNEMANPVILSSFQQLHDKNLISREKIFEHFFIDSNSNTALQTFKSMQAIWLSKVYLVGLVLNNEKDAAEFCWFDASVSRFKNRKKAEFSAIKIKNDKIYHYSSIMMFFGKRMPLNASVLLGTRSAWNELISLYNEQLESITSCGLPIDEEIVLMNCLVNKPFLFQLIDKQENRNVLHKVLGKILFPLNGFLLKCINWDNRLIKNNKY